MILPLSHLPPHPRFDGHFTSYETLELPHSLVAFQFLRRVAYIVSPIMARRGWTVPLLSELPASSSCYGVCHTKTIITHYGRFRIPEKTKVPARIEQSDKVRTSV
jgi:hypothetical protein